MRRFAHRLCLALGGMTVSELLERISSAELTDWMAFYQLEPWGGFQDEYRAALIASMVANTARDEKRRREPFRATEFMRAEFLEETAEETAEEPEQETLDGKILAIFGALAGGGDGIKSRNRAGGGAGDAERGKAAPAGGPH